MRRARDLEADNVSLTLGPPSGYIIRFTNGLVAYLTGDTGIHAEMQTVGADYLQGQPDGAQLGASALTPEGAAYVVNTLVQPASVILSHVNEAATSGGKVRAGVAHAPRSSRWSRDGRSIRRSAARRWSSTARRKCVAGC